MKNFLKFKWLAAKILLVLVFIIFCLSISGLEYGDYREVNILNANAEAELIILELEIGEEYDLKDKIIAAKQKINKELYKKIDGSLELQFYSFSKVISLNDTKIKALDYGVSIIVYSYNYTSHYDEQYSQYDYNSMPLFYVQIIIKDNNEANWIPVYSVDDIGSENKTYVLRNDLNITETYEKPYILQFFTGNLINPDGYTITFNESSNLSRLFYFNLGLVDGLIIKYNSNKDFVSIGGLMIALANEGLVRNCDIEMNIEATKIRLNIGSLQNNSIRGNFAILEGEDSIFTFYMWKNSSISNTFDFTIQGDTSNINIIEESFGNNVVNITILEDAPSGED